MRLADFLDKGVSVNPSAPCLTMAGITRSYADVQRLSWLIGRALARSGVRPGDKVAILSGNDPIAFSAIFGIARAGAVWCPLNPRNGAADCAELLDLIDCSCLLFESAFASLVQRIAGDLPKLATLVCLDAEPPAGIAFRRWLDGVDAQPFQAEIADNIVAIAATGGTTGRPKGVLLTGNNVQTMTALALMSFPFDGRPVYLNVTPLHAAVMLCFPIMTLGGEIVMMPAPDLTELLALVGQHEVTHMYLPTALIYELLDHPALPDADLSSLQCLWYGLTPMPAARLGEAITRIGPVLGQLFGQTEAPMLITAMAPQDHLHPDGSLAAERFSSAGRPTPLTTVAIMNQHGRLLPAGERGEIVVRGPLVMAGYYRNAAATATASRYGWHHTGDIGYLDPDNYLYIVDRAEDMIITGGFNVYSAEVEQALLAHPAVLDCAVVGLPDDNWGERVVAVIQTRQGSSVEDGEIEAFARERLGGVKAPRQVEIWPDLPRSRMGKVVKHEVRSRLLGASDPHGNRPAY